MICVLSFCSADRDMALALAQHIECLGGVEKHDAMVLHPAEVNGHDIYAAMERVFRRTDHCVYAERLHGWPDGPNQCFQEACERVYLRKDGQPWLWLEADCVPTRPSWLDDIQREYYWEGRTILGTLNNTWDGRGTVTGKHVTGVAVYPQDLIKTVPLLRTLTKATEQHRKHGNGIPPAFDCYIAPYTVKNCAQTKVISNYWKSRNFTEQPDGSVTCEFQIPYGISNVIDMDSALIHGAKDFSLLDIVQKRLCTA